MLRKREGGMKGRIRFRGEDKRGNYGREREERRCEERHRKGMEDWVSDGGRERRERGI